MSLSQQQNKLKRLTINQNSIGLLAVLCAFSLSGCAVPLLVGSGAAVGVMATREKGITSSLSDSEISVRIKGKLYGYDKKLHAYVGLNVQNGEVLLTGSVPKEEWIIEAERLSWQVRGVKAVHNNLTSMKDPDSITEAMGSVPKDSFITTQLKTKLLLEDNIKSLNYSIKTVDSVVYIMGIGRNQNEVDKVIKIASKIGGVKKVVNYIEIDQEDQTIEDTKISTSKTKATSEIESHHPTDQDEDGIDPTPAKNN